MAKKETKEIEVKEPKHARKTFTDKYANLLEDILWNDDKYMFEYISEREEFVRTGHIYSVALYRDDMIEYLDKYGYDYINKFCKEYKRNKDMRKRERELKRGVKENDNETTN